MGVHFKKNEEKLTLGMIIAGIVLIAILLTSLIIYLLNSHTDNLADYSQEEQVIGEVEQSNEDEFETVSINIGKSVNESTNDLNNTVGNKDNNTNTGNEVNTNTNNKTTKNNTTSSSNATNASPVENKEKSKEEPIEEVKFTAPIKGDVIREFAPDSLVYSETLQEWVTHNGVDIKADKTSVVTAATSGTVYAIKNDPRYGLTVIVNHENGYQTLYANLLTAEYVVEGEELQAGQTIGTVGNSATFEIEDDYHLHFEMKKDGEYVDPNSYMKF